MGRTWLRGRRTHIVLGVLISAVALGAVLQCYKKSLEIEWNQPPAGEAVRRLEKRIGP